MIMVAFTILRYKVVLRIKSFEAFYINANNDEQPENRVIIT